jgi:hypothetical protein
VSGTGPTPAEQHLGDRLAALVDGELKHDARERVLAHLATCSRCKAEADAQRRLKSAFATSAAPSPSEGFLARLQGLPGGSGGDDDGRDGRRDGRPDGRRRFGDGIFPVLPPGPADSGRSPLDGFGYLPTAHGSTAVLPRGSSGRGFRIHDVSREADRSPWRARRFAFAAAGAVSLAAIALGGVLPLDYSPETPLSAEGAGSSRTPLDAQERTGSAGAAASRSGGGALAAGDGQGSPAPSTAVRPVLASAPALLSTPALLGGTFTFPMLNVTVPPLIRPTDAGPLYSASPGAAADPAPAASASTPPLYDRAMPLSPLR